MTATVDERRRIAGNTRTLPEGVVEYAVIFRAHEADPESRRHQQIASTIYEARRAEGEPAWAELPREERVPFYSRCDGLV